MKKMLLLLALYVYGCLLFPAAAQTRYTITEAELQKLENISTALEERNQSLLQQVQALTNNSKQLESKALLLQQKLHVAQTTSKKLNELLLTERITSQNLSASLTAYEKEATRVQTELNNEKLKRQKNINQRNVCLAAAILQALVILGFIALKIIIWLKRLV